MAAEEKENAVAPNKVTIEEVGPCKKKVIIEIPEATIAAKADEQYESLRKDAVVPGFRKGRAPRRLLEKRFGKEATQQIKLQLLAEASESALKDNEINYLRDPDIDYESIELPEGGAMKFDFEVEVRPEFDLPELEKIPVEKVKIEVKKEQIDSEIEQLCKYSGVWTPREKGGVEEGDQIIADVWTKVEGTEAEEKNDNEEILVRANGNVSGVPVEKLDELLKGAKADDTKDISVEVAKTFYNEELRGKKVDLKIEIKDVKYMKPAEIDEAFLQRFGVESEDELRERISESLEVRMEREVRQHMAAQVNQYLSDKTDFELPVDIVADQARNLLQRQYVNMLMQGVKKEQLEEDMEQLQAGSEEQAREQMKQFFIMDKVAEKLEVEVSEEEINGYIAQVAMQRGTRPERLREEMARDGSIAQFGMQVRDEKCIGILLEKAEVKEVDAPKGPKKSAKKKETKKKSKKPDAKEADKKSKPKRKPPKKSGSDKKKDE